MALFKKKEEVKSRALAVQSRRGAAQPFFNLDSYVPLGTPEQKMYDALREAVPVIDAAIDKILRLIGGVKVSCKNPDALRELKKFTETVKVGASGIGLEAFIHQYLDRLLTWGTVVGEIVPYSDGTVAALYCADSDWIDLYCDDDDPLNCKVCVRKVGESIPVKHQERMLLCALNPMPGKAVGTSILRGLPFVSSILLKIYNTIGNNWERVGNLRYAVTYKPTGALSDATFGNDAVNQISEEWTRAMSETESVRDFVAVGDVDVKVIGADNQILDSEIPVRQLLEQIIAKLGIPPFMLGISWSSTERMSQQQADILTSELESYRKQLTPIIRKVCEWQLRALGYGDEVKVDWSDINLQDEVESARSELYRAQARSLAKSEKEDI